MIGWYAYVASIWLLKSNLLFFYKRILFAQCVEKFILPTLVLVVVCGVVIFLILSIVCQPFHGLWQVYPDPGCKAHFSVSERKEVLIGIYSSLYTAELGILDTHFRHEHIHRCYDYGYPCTSEKYPIYNFKNLSPEHSD
jgi:hypothetical protein